MPKRWATKRPCNIFSLDNCDGFRAVEATNRLTALVWTDRASPAFSSRVRSMKRMLANSVVGATGMIRGETITARTLLKHADHVGTKSASLHLPPPLILPQKARKPP